MDQACRNTRNLKQSKREGHRKQEAHWFVCKRLLLQHDRALKFDLKWQKTTLSGPENTFTFPEVHFPCSLWTQENPKSLGRCHPWPTETRQLWPNHNRSLDVGCSALNAVGHKGNMNWDSWAFIIQQHEHVPLSSGDYYKPPWPSIFQACKPREHI